MTMAMSATTTTVRGATADAPGARHEAARPVLSIVIPTLDEAATIGSTLAALQPLRARGGVEVVVVDGGSVDGTPDVAAAAGADAVLVDVGRGRARQMNAGAAAARGAVLLFLHADTRLPRGADRRVARALAWAASAADARHHGQRPPEGQRERGLAFVDPQVRSHAKAVDGAAAGQAPAGDDAGTRYAGWGRFDVCIDGRSRWLAIVAAAMNLRSRLTGIATGDQAIFVTATLFRHVGGFPEQPLMEDIELSRRLRRVQRPACLRTKVVTSGRRWDRDGVWPTIRLMWRLRWRYWRGESAEALAREYR